MTIGEFIRSLPEWQIIICIILFILAIWGCIAPYVSLLHLGGIEKQLRRIADEIEKYNKHIK